MITQLEPNVSEESETITRAIGNRRSAQRRALGPSLAELGETTGHFFKSRVSTYDQDIRRMGGEEAEVLAAALGDVTPDFLLGVEGGGPIPTHELTVLEAYRRPGPEAGRWAVGGGCAEGGVSGTAASEWRGLSLGPRDDKQCSRQQLSIPYPI